MSHTGLNAKTHTPLLWIKFLQGEPLARFVRGYDVEICTGLHAKKDVLLSCEAITATTFFMNLFHGGRLATMLPKLLNEEGDLFVYRPFAMLLKLIAKNSPVR